jgi:hypothetical protein
MKVNVPGHGVVEFPDGMSEAEIVAALKANEPQQSGAELTAKSTGFGEAFMASAGKKTQDMLDGILQLYLKAAGDDKALGGLATSVAARNAEFAPLLKERPVATGLGSALPAMAVPGAGAGYLGAMAAAALPELLSYGTAAERASKGGVAALGGAAGRAIGGGITAVLKPAGVGVNSNAAAMEAAKRIGYKPLAGQATQNPAMLNVENYLARNPGSSGTMQAINAANQSAVNRAATSSIGQAGDDVGSGVLGAAQRELGSEFTRLQGVTSPRLGADFMQSLVTIETKNAALGSFRKTEVDSLIKKSLDLAASGKLSGQAYKEIHTELSAQATKAFKAGDAVEGKAVKTVREALDEAAGKSLSPADRAAWDTVRQQWGNWKTLTKGQVAEAGNVSPARVASQLRQQGPGFRTGSTSGPLVDVGRIGEGIKSALNPNSGNLPQMALYGNPITGIPLSVGNFVTAKVYTSPIAQWYLRRGLLDIGEGGELIVKATGVPLGIAGTKSLLGVE